MFKGSFIYAILVSLLILANSTKASSFDSLFDHSQYKNAKISPDGKHIAASALYQGKYVIIFFDRDNLNPVGSANFSSNYEPGDFFWVNNKRIVIEMVKRTYSTEEPVSYGELYAVNFDGSRGEMIYGYQSGMGSSRQGSRFTRKESIRGWGEIIDILPEDEKHILISSTPMSNTGERFSSVLKINIYSGIVKKDLGKAPISFARFLTDTKGNLRALVGTDKNNHNIIYIKYDDGWTKLPNNTVSSSVSPIAISKSGKYLYTLDNYDQDLFGLFKLNLEDLSYRSVYTDKTVDISDIEMTTNGRTAYALRVDDSYPAYLILNKKVEEAKVLKSLLKSFPYSEVNITSKTLNGGHYLVKVSSDVDPGSLYLFDKEKNKLQILFQFKPEHSKTAFAQVEPIQFKATDNQIIHALFTQSQVTDKKALPPVVILVHGGPHGVRDFWGYSSQVQYLALNGYSVLQVNYRGSGGYGAKFELAGHRVWGTVIQQDIYEAYQWLIKKKKAKPNNACIMGGSFGAYSAIQSAIKYPDTYKCAIANAGIYDLQLMFDEGDIQERKAGESYLKQVLGTNTHELQSMSPVNHVAKIKIPLLLAHGKDDERAPFEHVERLQEALDKAKKPYEWFVIDKEGHGFYNPVNQKAYMKKVLLFLNKNLS